VADALDRARVVVDAARAARERSWELLLRRQLTRTRRPPVAVDPMTEEVLRDRLTH
jgi:hypothetical protein